MSKQYSKSFTLIELLVVLALIAILSTVLILIIKPGQIFSRARDTKRINDLKNIEKIMDTLYATDQTFNELNYASSNVVYISLPDNNTNCSNWLSQLPSLPSGWSYRCSANPTNIDGSGWIPIPFNSFPILNISQLPIDPRNKPPYYYSFVVGGSYAVYGQLEDPKHQASKNDGDNYPHLFSAGNNKRLIDQAQGLVGYWPFDEGSGTIAKDYSGNGNNGTLVNGPTWTTGKVGGALSFDGVDDWLSVSDSDSLDLTNKGAISFWLYVPSWGSNYASIIMKGIPSSGWCSNAHNPFHIFNHYTANYIPFSMCSATAINYVVISPRPSTGIWHFYVYTFDGSYLKAYLDGVMVSSVTQTISMKVDTNPVRIGGGNVYFNGTIDEVRLYNRALSDTEIKALYDATK
jgi:prepilin-type N-terminal cleavage/methylation domain-containing protein